MSVTSEQVSIQRVNPGTLPCETYKYIIAVGGFQAAILVLSILTDWRAVVASERISLGALCFSL